MKNLYDAPELDEFERRVKSYYGRMRLSLEAHNEILATLNNLRTLCKQSDTMGEYWKPDQGEK